MASIKGSRSGSFTRRCCLRPTEADLWRFLPRSLLLILSCADLGPAAAPPPDVGFGLRQVRLSPLGRFAIAA